MNNNIKNISIVKNVTKIFFFAFIVLGLTFTNVFSEPAPMGAYSAKDMLNPSNVAPKWGDDNGGYNPSSIITKDKTYTDTAYTFSGFEVHELEDKVDASGKKIKKLGETIDLAKWGKKKVQYTVLERKDGNKLKADDVKDKAVEDRFKDNLKLAYYKESKDANKFENYKPVSSKTMMLGISSKDNSLVAATADGWTGLSGKTDNSKSKVSNWYADVKGFEGKNLTVKFNNKIKEDAFFDSNHVVSQMGMDVINKLLKEKGANEVELTDDAKSSLLDNIAITVRKVEVLSAAEMKTRTMERSANNNEHGRIAARAFHLINGKVDFGKLVDEGMIDDNNTSASTADNSSAKKDLLSSIGRTLLVKNVEYDLKIKLNKTVLNKILGVELFDDTNNEIDLTGLKDALPTLSTVCAPHKAWNGDYEVLDETDQNKFPGYFMKTAAATTPENGCFAASAGVKDSWHARRYMRYMYAMKCNNAVNGLGYQTVSKYIMSMLQNKNSEFFADSPEQLRGRQGDNAPADAVSDYFKEMAPSKKAYSGHTISKGMEGVVVVPLTTLTDDAAKEHFMAGATKAGDITPAKNDKIAKLMGLKYNEVQMNTIGGNHARISGVIDVWGNAFNNLLGGLATNGEDSGRAGDTAWQRFDQFIGGADHIKDLEALKASANVKSYFASALVDKKVRSGCKGFVMEPMYGIITGTSGDREYNSKAMVKNKAQSSLVEAIADKMKSINGSLEDGDERQKKSKRVVMFGKDFTDAKATAFTKSVANTFDKIFSIKKLSEIVSVVKDFNAITLSKFYTASDQSIALNQFVQLNSIAEATMKKAINYSDADTIDLTCYSQKPDETNNNKVSGMIYFLGQKPGDVNPHAANKFTKFEKSKMVANPKDISLKNVKKKDGSETEYIATINVDDVYEVALGKLVQGTATLKLGADVAMASEKWSQNEFAEEMAKNYEREAVVELTPEMKDKIQKQLGDVKTVKDEVVTKWGDKGFLESLKKNKNVKVNLTNDEKKKEGQRLRNERAGSPAGGNDPAAGPDGETNNTWFWVGTILGGGSLAGVLGYAAFYGNPLELIGLD